MRKKLEETFGQFELAGTPEPRDASDDEEQLVQGSRDGAEKRRVVEIEYLKEGDDEPDDAPRRAVHDRARAARLARAHVGSHGRRRRARSGSTGCARRGSPTTRFEPRDGFDPSYLREPASRAAPGTRRSSRAGSSSAARVRSPTGRPSPRCPFKTEEWLLSEVLADRGETIVLEPQRLRDLVAKRARRLQRELGRVPTRR